MQLRRDIVVTHPIAEDAMDERLVDQRPARIVAQDAIQPRDVAVEGRRSDHQQHVDRGRRQPELVGQLGNRRRRAAILRIRGKHGLVLRKRIPRGRDVVGCVAGVLADERRDLVLVRMMALVAIAEPPRIPGARDGMQRPQHHRPDLAIELDQRFHPRQPHPVRPRLERVDDHARQRLDRPGGRHRGVGSLGRGGSKLERRLVQGRNLRCLALGRLRRRIHITISGVSERGGQAGGRAHTLADRSELEIAVGEADRQDFAVGIDGEVGHLSIGHDGAEVTGEPEIEDGQPACSVVDHGKAATRRKPDRARQYGDSLEDAPAGEREDDDLAPADLFGDQRERGPLEHDATTGDPAPERQRRRQTSREGQAQPRIGCEPTTRDRDHSIDVGGNERE